MCFFIYNTLIFLRMKLILILLKEKKTFYYLYIKD